jgi:outer membrane protein assembly factor BamE (lipoprotein component of BamABCDE complex)
VRFDRSGFWHWALSATAAVALGACAPTVIKRGHQFQDNDIQQIQTGMSQAQVTGVLGSPTTTATVNGAQTLYYISSTERQMAFLSAEETDRRVLAVYFTPLGAVERVSQYGLKDGKVINFSANQTANSARDENVIKQLFRKLGTKQLFGNDN